MTAILPMEAFMAMTEEQQMVGRPPILKRSVWGRLPRIDQNIKTLLLVMVVAIWQHQLNGGVERSA